MFSQNTSFLDSSDLFNLTRTSRFKEGRMLQKILLLFREIIIIIILLIIIIIIIIITVYSQYIHLQYKWLFICGKNETTKLEIELKFRVAPQLLTTSNFIGPWYHAALLFSGLGSIVLLFGVLFSQQIREDLVRAATSPKIYVHV